MMVKVDFKEYYYDLLDFPLRRRDSLILDMAMFTTTISSDFPQ